MRMSWLTGGCRAKIKKKNLGDLMMLTLLLSLSVGIVCCVTKFSEEYSASFYKVYLNGVIKSESTLLF